MYDLIVKAKYILPMNDALEIIQDGFVAITDGKIAAIGQEDILDKGIAVKEIIDAGNAIVMPGLINAHTHAAMAYFRGLADDLPLDIWLQKHIWPAEAKYVKPDFVRNSLALACLEMIKSGTTCFSDMYFFQESAAEIVANAGLRALLSEVILDFPSPSSPHPQDAMDKTVRLVEQFKDDGLIKIALAPHAIYTVAKENLLAIKELRDKYSLPIHIHLSETKKEEMDSREKYQKSPVEYLADIGLLNDRLMAAHCVWLSDNDIEIIAESGAKAVHCPASNMKLGSGISPVGRMIKNNIIVGLGTDGQASNNSLDMFDAMRLAALLPKAASLDPELVKAREVVKMATIDGAKVIGQEKEIGSLVPGKKADLITINLNQPHLVPLSDPYSHLAYCVRGGDVNDVIVNGSIIMRNREVKTLDEKAIIVQASAFRIEA